MPGKGTPRRAIRIPEPLWVEAKQYAHDDGKDLAVLIRQYLERYVRRERAKRD